MEDLQNHDEKMFMVTILIVHMAASRQKLENLVYSAEGITNTQNCDFNPSGLKNMAGSALSDKPDRARRLLGLSVPGF